MAGEVYGRRERHAMEERLEDLEQDRRAVVRELERLESKRFALDREIRTARERLAEVEVADAARDRFFRAVLGGGAS